jgi:AcrR family transcriptional regulator
MSSDHGGWFMASEKPTTKVAQREATTKRLLEVARRQFTEHGYAQTATEAIVEEAGVTRGALYHHFGSKDGLFKAVVEVVQQDVAKRIEEAVSKTNDPWQQLLIGCKTFLTASMDADIQQIMLVDAPAVLGFETWREIDSQNSMRLLQESVQELVDKKMIQTPSVEAFTHLLSGAMNEAALWVARSPNPKKPLSEATKTLEHLLEAVRKT